MLRQPRICKTETRWLAACTALAIGEYLGFRCQGFSAAWPALAVVAILFALFGFGLNLPFWAYATIGITGFTFALAAVAFRLDTIHDVTVRSSGVPYCAVFTLADDALVKHTQKNVTLAEFKGEIGALNVKIIAEIQPGTAPPKAGETWRCTGWLSRWNDRDAMASRIFWVRGKRSSIECIDSAAQRFSLARTLNILRKDAARRLRFGLETDRHAHNLLCAMLLGERHLMGIKDKNTFVRAGALHIFAISGLHVVVLAEIFVLLGILALVPLRFAGIVAVPLIWLYVMMVGSPPSAVRAGAMASFRLIAPIFWREPNSIVAWSMAFILAHILNPAQIIDAGSGFSFVIMLTLAILMRLGDGKLKHPFASTIIFSFTAWAAALPISARIFGKVALSGLISGPLVVPAATCATICGALGVLASFISNHLAAYPNALAGLIMRFMFATCSLISKIPGATIEIAQWSIAQCLAWYVALAVFIWLTLSFCSRRSSLPMVLHQPSTS